MIRTKNNSLRRKDIDFLILSFVSFAAVVISFIKPSEFKQTPPCSNPLSYKLIQKKLPQNNKLAFKGAHCFAAAPIVS